MFRAQSNIAQHIQRDRSFSDGRPGGQNKHFPRFKAENHTVQIRETGFNADVNFMAQNFLNKVKSAVNAVFDLNNTRFLNAEPASKNLGLDFINQSFGVLTLIVQYKSDSEH